MPKLDQTTSTQTDLHEGDLVIIRSTLYHENSLLIGTIQEIKYFFFRNGREMICTKDEDGSFFLTNDVEKAFVQ